MPRHIRSIRLALFASCALTGILPAQRPLPAAARLALDSVVDQVTALGLVPGMGIAIVRDGAVVYERYAGWADREAGRRVDSTTVFYIASSTKSFTALATTLLDRAGTLRLDATLAQLLPGTPLANGLDPRRITVRQLLSHTHGISSEGPVSYRAAYSGEIDRREMLAAIATHPRAAGGTTYAYSNLGYNILSLAIDSIAGMPWQDVLAERVFAPLGLSSTSARVSTVPRDRLAMPYRLEPDGLARLPYGKHDANMQAAGGIVSTIRNLARFTTMMIDGGRVDGRQVFPDDVIAEVLRVQARFEARYGDITRYAYGLGWNHGVIGGDTLLHHFGGFPGFTASVSFMPRHRTGVVVATNGALGTSVQDVVMAYAYALANGNVAEEARLRARLALVPALLSERQAAVAADRARRAARSQVTPLPITAYAGRFRHEAWGTLDLTVRDGRLHARNGVIEDTGEAYEGATHQWRFELPPGQGVLFQFHVQGPTVTAVTVDGLARLERVR